MSERESVECRKSGQGGAVNLQVGERERHLAHVTLNAPKVASKQMVGDSSSFNNSTQVGIGAECRALGASGYIKEE
jgi:hypothetical protein